MTIQQTALDHYAPELEAARLPDALPDAARSAAEVLRFQPRPGSASKAELTASELWLALKEERIVPHYQTQFDLASGRTFAVEALARVIDEDGNPIRPDRFIAEAESSGVIVGLGRSIIRQACSALADWRASGSYLQRVSVNLSSKQLNLDATLAPFLRRTVAEFGLSATDFEFELTEGQFLQTGCLGLDTLSELRDLGARLAIDDFGVNDAFIPELASIDVDTVKLHPAIVGRLTRDGKATDLTRLLIGFALELGKHVVAEGIETAAQIEQLLQLGCCYGQGYVHTQPMPKADIHRFLQS